MPEKRRKPNRIYMHERKTGSNQNKYASRRFTAERDFFLSGGLKGKRQAQMCVGESGWFYGGAISPLQRVISSLVRAAITLCLLLFI